MTQEEVDLVYSITIAMYEHPWFKEKSRTRDEVQNWVREQLSAHNILTVPAGMAWGVLCSKERYNQYSTEYANSKRS